TSIHEGSALCGVITKLFFPAKNRQNRKFYNRLTTKDMLRVFMGSTRTIDQGSKAILRKSSQENKILIDSNTRRFGIQRITALLNRRFDAGFLPRPLGLPDLRTISPYPCLFSPVRQREWASSLCDLCALLCGSLPSDGRKKLWHKRSQRRRGVRLSARRSRST